MIRSFSLSSFYQIKKISFINRNIFNFFFLIVFGPLGYVIYRLPSFLFISLVRDNKKNGKSILIFSSKNKNILFLGTFYNLFFSQLNNFLFFCSRILFMNGFEFYLELKKKDLYLFFGYSHEIIQRSLSYLKLFAAGNNLIVYGLDLNLIDNFLDLSFKLHKQDSYKNKGLFFINSLNKSKKIKKKLKKA